MAKVEITTGIGKDELTQLEAAMPRLGEIGLRSLDAIRKIAGVAQDLGDLTIELRLRFELSEQINTGLGSNAALLSKTLEDALPVIVANPLLSYGLNTVADLLTKTPAQVRKIRGVGSVRWMLIKEFLEGNGLSLKKA